jgi:hypothetical protein
MLLFSIPVLGVVLFMTKPRLETFGDFLAMVDKKATPEVPTEASGIMGFLTKTIEKTASLFINPAHAW